MRRMARYGAMVFVNALGMAGGLLGQEMKMPKQEQSHHMEMPAVTAEYPRMGRAQERALGALVTLEQVQKIAADSNPTLRQAEAEIRATKARQHQAGLYPNPTVGYTGDEIRGGSVGGGKQGFFLQQAVVTGGKLALSREVFGKEVKLAEIEAEEQKIRVQSAVKMAFLRVLAAQELLEARREMAKIAQDAGALFFVDMAHIAGLVAAGIHPSPVPHADFVSTTTHKTLRGPRGGLVLCREKYAKDLDRITFPGVQGGPLEHIIAAKAVCLKEAAEPEFRMYQKQVVTNASVLAAALAKHGFRIVTGGTDNHLFLVDMHSRGITGRDAELALERAGMTVNKNAIPFDPLPPMKAGGIRVGTPAVTTRGMREPEMNQIAGWIADVLTHLGDSATEQRVRGEVATLAARFPLYARRLEEAENAAALHAHRANP